MTQAAQPLRKFQFLQEIASGGFGSVYLAKLITPDGVSRVVAVKLLHRRWSDNVEVSSRMRDEARLLSRLRHDNIVEVLDFAVIDGRSAVVMECLEAVDTRVILDACREAGTRMPIAAVFGICGAVASALDAAYNRPPSPGARPMRVIHRDIKPSNVMVDADGRVKVLDFGVARAEFDAREAKTAELAFGSLEYMPPERLFFEPESAASDVYSLGTAIFELLALDKLGKAKLRQSEQEKFLAERLADLTESYPLTPEADADVIDLLKRMLAFDESQRPTAAQVAELAATVSARCVAGGLPGLADWAATALPPLIDLSRTKRAGPGTLIGETILEDPPEAVAMMPRPSVLLGPDDDGDGAEDETAMHTDLLGADEPLEAEIDATVRDDTRWMELKSATLASLGETAEVDASVLQEVQLRVGRARNRPEDLDSEASRNPLQWLEDDDDEFEGAPTVRMHSSEAM
ncbi:MAG: serine/threonine-protein kinase, partial [Myxococcota bacterium]